MVKKYLPMQETWVWSLGWEDPLEKKMTTNLPGKSHRQRSLVGYSPWGCRRVRYDLVHNLLSLKQEERKEIENLARWMVDESMFGLLEVEDISRNKKNPPFSKLRALIELCKGVFLLYFSFLMHIKGIGIKRINKKTNRWNTRPPRLPLEKPVCRSGSNS